MSKDPNPDSAQRLLHDAPAPPPAPRGVGRVLAVVALAIGSFIFAYHSLVLVTWNTPRKAVGRDFHTQVMKYTQGRAYFRATGSQQSWSMFAPNPNRMNNFVEAYVRTEDGELWDMDHDIYKKNRYPYLWYDRMGKINRRINGKRGYQRVYGAWLCRQWEREHGELPKEVLFVRTNYRIPRPWDNSHRNGPLHLAYSPWEMPTHEVRQETIECATAEHGQNPERLRERFGLEPAPEGFVKEPKLVTWWIRKEREAEAERRKKEARERLEQRRRQSQPRPNDGAQSRANRPRPVPLDAPVRELPAHGRRPGAMSE